MADLLFTNADGEKNEVASGDATFQYQLAQGNETVIIAVDNPGSITHIQMRINKKEAKELRDALNIWFKPGDK